MNTRMQIPAKPMTAPARHLASEPFGILRRKCACGGSGGSNSECAECKQKKLQRRASGSGPETPPPIVHDVLRSPGRPLDRGTRAFMEPRFGHDFGNVRVHTDARADESTRAVNALAYTVGPDVVFADGQYAPTTQPGLRLLAHELAHAVQDPDGTRVQHALQVGRTDDPAEAAADRTADAVMRGDRVSVNSGGGGVLRRQQRTCTATADPDKDKRIVTCGDEKYRVTMTATTEPGGSRTSTSVNPGWNNQEIWLDFSICRGGTLVQITPKVGLDLPQAVTQVLENLQSGSPALQNVQVQPGVRITVAHSKGSSVSVGPSVTVDTRGVSGGGANVTVETPQGSVTGEVDYDARNRGVSGSITFRPGRTQPQFECHDLPKQKLAFNCEQITHVKGQNYVPPSYEPLTTERYILFKYKEAEFNPDELLPTDIAELHSQGYKVKKVEGFTSPEGPLEEGPNFKGNKVLSRGRAYKARDWLLENCKGCLELADLVPKEGDELPLKLGREIPEPKGPGMERRAIKEFLGTDEAKSTPDPLAPHDPESLAAFQKLPAKKQREEAFTKMRRATITLVKEKGTLIDEGKPEIREHDDSKKVDCPQEVANAANVSFGFSALSLNPPK